MEEPLYNKSDNPIPNFIIAGTAKAATTSIFRYLSEHPDVCCSSVKETAFFENEYTGNREVDIVNYSSYFRHCPAVSKIVFEGSAGYLDGGRTIAERIFSFSPDIRLLFILRNPAERLYSYYSSSVATLKIDKNIDFDEFADKCLEYASGKKPASAMDIEEEQLTYLESGRYSQLIYEYLEHFKPDSIKIMFYENLKTNTLAFMEELCEFLDLNSEFYANYAFLRINATFSGRINLLHRFAMFANKKLERLLRRRPYLKDLMVGAYKKLNMQRKGYADMSDSTRLMLTEYYRPYNKALAEMVTNRQKAPDWVNLT